ncbi:hypothetical protein SAMN05216403_11154 [Nitrosospira multiformis ATCC 25196]|uniref:Uncharacterized protein n=2 Tax=Nitrosospira multiformis (strain ATCC 25196 / NCIMB 11849 / C 71) TaxID=323848 RepID=A0A1H5VB03_NITMU|nr:hypothetical protein [Nitrosospira multiformis]SEF84489.1 hypothetical protein SAMN05216403_11154 [Nitrosospira multiformis ATCC 25196]
MSVVLLDFRMNSVYSAHSEGNMLLGSNILEVGIAVIFVYLLLSLVCTALNEGIASLIDKRGNLVEGIKNLLNDPKFTGLAQQLYNHGLIGGISQYASDPSKRTRLPSYMSGESFSLALLDILSARGIIAGKYGDLLANAEAADDAYEEALEAAAVTPGDPQRVAAVTQAKDALDRARVALEAIAEKAKVAYGQAVQAAKTAPDDMALVKAEAEARHEIDSISAALKMLDARHAAIASAKNPKEVKLLLTADATLKEALAFARDFATEYPDPLGNIQEGLKRLPEGHTKETLLVLVDKTRREVTAIEHQAEAFRKNLEDWFNKTMERVGGWYKRWTQRVLLCLATLVVVASNADTVMLIERLSKDNVLRASIVAAAEDTVKTQADAVSADTALKAAENLKLPVGWSLDPYDSGYFRPPELSWKYTGWAFYKIFGLLISILAVTLGAPFWFDTLSKFVNLRSAGTPPGESSKSAPQSGR